VDGPLTDKPGRAGWTWYTGSAAWLNRVCLEWVLGIRPTWGEGKEGGLTIDPCPPAELGKVSVRRTWRGVPVRVRFDAAEFVPGVRPTLTVSCGGGAETVIDGNTLPASMLKPAGLDVVVRWGKSPALGEAKAAGVARPTGA
jgi:cellobiose phosphorylase